MSFQRKELHFFSNKTFYITFCFHRHSFGAAKSKRRRFHWPPIGSGRESNNSKPFSITKSTVSDFCRLQTADRGLQTADYRLQTAHSRPQAVDYKMFTEHRWSKILKTTELKTTQILVVLKFCVFGRIKDDMGMGICIDSVTLKFTRRWSRRAYWSMVTSRIACSSIFFTRKKEMNIIMQDARLVLAFTSIHYMTVCGVEDHSFQ